MSLFKERDAVRASMKAQGLSSFVVSYDYLPLDAPHPDPLWDDEPETMHFWAEDAGHAGEQFEDSEPEARILLIETQTEYQDRTNHILPY